MTTVLVKQPGPGAAMGRPMAWLTGNKLMTINSGALVIDIKNAVLQLALPLLGNNKTFV